jgi:hypothetical protein
MKDKKKKKDLRIGDKVYLFDSLPGKVLDIDYNEQFEQMALVEYFGRSGRGRPRKSRGSLWAYVEEIRLADWSE